MEGGQLTKCIFVAFVQLDYLILWTDHHIRIALESVAHNHFLFFFLSLLL